MEANEILNKANYIIRGSVDSTTAKRNYFRYLNYNVGVGKRKT